MKFRTACCSVAMLLMAVSSVAFADVNDDRKPKFKPPQPNLPQQTATAVPEPEVYGMMLAGLGIVGFAARRKLKSKPIKPSQISQM